MLISILRINFPSEFWKCWFVVFWAFTVAIKKNQNHSPSSSLFFLSFWANLGQRFSTWLIFRISWELQPNPTMRDFEIVGLERSQNMVFLKISLGCTDMQSRLKTAVSRSFVSKYLNFMMLCYDVQLFIHQATYLLVPLIWRFRSFNSGKFVFPH